MNWVSCKHAKLFLYTDQNYDIFFDIYFRKNKFEVTFVWETKNIQLILYVFEPNVLSNIEKMGSWRYCIEGWRCIVSYFIKPWSCDRNTIEIILIFWIFFFLLCFSIKLRCFVGWIDHKPFVVFMWNV